MLLLVLQKKEVMLVLELITGEAVYLDFAAAIQRYGKNRHT
jgi:hypothetical protein